MEKARRLAFRALAAGTHRVLTRLQFARFISIGQGFKYPGARYPTVRDCAWVECCERENGAAMAYTERIVCLAASTKLGGVCVAGKRVSTRGEVGDWVRPVGDRPTGELTVSEIQCGKSMSPRLLDILEIRMLKPKPHAYQVENHLIDTKTPWLCVGQFPSTQASELLDDVTALWTNDESSANGLNDQIPEAAAAKLGSSLLLIQPKSFSVSVGIEWAGMPYQKRTVRGHLRYHGTDYTFKVSDPDFDAQYKARGDGEYSFEAGSVALCISISEPIERKGTGRRYCYKLIAGVIALP